MWSVLVGMVPSSSSGLVAGLVPACLGGAVPVCLGNHSQSGSRLFKSFFPSGKDSDSLLSRDWPLSLNELVLHSLFIIVPVAPVLLSIEREISYHPFALSVACLLYPLFRIRGRFLWLLSVPVVVQFVALCFWTVDYLRCSPVLQRSA